MECFSNMDDVYIHMSNKVKSSPFVSPRGVKVRELTAQTFELSNPRKRIIGNGLRKVSLAFSVGEFLWYLRGSNELEIMQYYSKMYPNFSDDGIYLHGAYGKRIFGEEKELNSSWYRIKQLLREDPDSRRAVLPIYNSGDVGYHSNDIPCTCLVQYFIRNDKLDCIVYMRANDLYLGTPYDVFSFSMLQELMACELGVELGTYTHMVGSLCVYEKNQLRIEAIADSKPENVIEMPRMTLLSDVQKQKVLKNEENLRKHKVADYEGLDRYWRNIVYILEIKANKDFIPTEDAFDYVRNYFDILKANV